MTGQKQTPLARARKGVRPPLERFWEKVEKTETCWLWTGAVSPNGYGAFWDGARQVVSHRAAYLLLVGPIADGMTVDHLCRVRSCVNPSHMEIVTRSENSRRGAEHSSFGAMKRAETCCKRGHAFDESNTYWDNGRRACRICRAACARRYRERKSNAAA